MCTGKTTEESEYPNRMIKFTESVHDNASRKECEAMARIGQHICDAVNAEYDSLEDKCFKYDWRI